MSERLDRIEKTMELLIEQQVRQSSDIVELKGIVENFSRNLMFLAQEQQRDREEFRHGFNVLQTDIRGLQTENRRILERLEQHTSDGHGG